MLVVFAKSFLCVWNRMLWENLRTVVLPRDFTRTRSIFRWISVSMSFWNDSFESCSNFSKEFSQWSDMIEKQRIINLSSNCNTNYASKVLSDTDVTFLGEGKDATFCPFLSDCLYTALTDWRSMWSNFIVFHISGDISSTPAAFLLLIFWYCIKFFLGKLSCFDV